ncbi:MAG: leucine-rich repeat protein [Bacteroidales bacterium]|nr:leucine-rich repeat protein [Bacteroidales bacterium]
MKRLLAFASLALCILSCNRIDEDGPTPGGEDYPPTYNAYGTSELFGTDAQVTVRSLDSKFKVSSTVHTVPTEENGAFRVETGDLSRYVQTEVKGSFANIPAGQMTSSPVTLKAISDIHEGPYFVNVLTTLEAAALEYYLKGTPTKADSPTFEQARHQADSAVLASFGIPLVLGISFDHLSNYGQDLQGQGVLLAIEILLFSGRTDAEVNRFLSSLESQLASTGHFTISPTDLQVTLDPEQVQENLYFIFHFSIIPPYLDYLDRDGDGVPDSLGIQADPALAMLDWDSTTLTVAVRAPEEYTVDIEPSGWIRRTDGEQDPLTSSSLRFTLDRNMDSQSRDATITLTCANGSSTVVNVRQNPDFSIHPAIITPDNWTEYKAEDYSKFPVVALEGLFTHPELSRIFEQLSGSTVLKELNLKKVETPDRVIGRHDGDGEDFCDSPLSDVPALKTLILPDKVEAVYGELLTENACRLEHLEFGSDNQLLAVSAFTENSFLGRCWRPASLEEIPSSVKTLKGGMFCGWDWISEMRIAPGTLVLIDRNTFHKGGMKRLTFGENCRLEMNPDDSDWTSFSSCGNLERLEFENGCDLILPYLIYLNGDDDYGYAQTLNIKEIIFGDNIQIRQPEGYRGHFIYGGGHSSEKIYLHLDKLSFGKNTALYDGLSEERLIRVIRACEIKTLSFAADGGLTLRRGMFGECRIGEITLSGNPSKLEIDLGFCDSETSIDKFDIDYRTIPECNVHSRAFGYRGIINDVENQTGVRLIYDGDYASRPIVERTTLEYHTNAPTVEIVKDGASEDEYNWRYNFELVLGPDVERIYCVQNECLTEVVGVSGRIKRIDNYAFQYCRHLKQFTWPDGLLLVPNSCFQGCTSLERVDNLPTSGLVIKDYAFNGTALTRINAILSASVSIGEYAFAGCKITEANLPAWMTEVPAGLFEGCERLSSITLPPSVVKVNHGAFSNCNLTSADFLAGVQLLDINSLSGFASDILQLPSGIREIYGDIYAKNAPQYLSKIILPGDFTRLDVCLWEVREAEVLAPADDIDRLGANERLETLTLPATVRRIGSLNCPGLYSFYVHAITPPTIDGDEFTPARTDYNIKIHIPAGTRSLYEAAPVWSAFKGKFVEDL